MNQIQTDANTITNDTADTLSQRFTQYIQESDECLDALMQAAIFFVNDLGMFNETTEAELAACLVARMTCTKYDDTNRF